MSTDTVGTRLPFELQEQRYDADHVAIEVAKRLPEAKEAVNRLCSRTPLVEHSNRTTPNLRVLTKMECMQVGRSFKSRGAMAAVDRYVRDNPEATVVVTASAGNHLQGVAHAAKALGLGVTGHTARSISAVKAERAASLGVTLDSTHATLEDALKVASLSGEAFIHPYDHYETMAGQGTLLNETLDDLEAQGVDLLNDQVIITVPVGGGGLLAGMAVSLYEQKRAGRAGDGVQLVGVQMENCDAARRFRDGECVDGEAFADGKLDTACDGTAVASPGKKTRVILEDSRFVRSIETVTKAELGGAMQKIFAELRVMAEPAGALAYALADKLRAAYATSHRSDNLVLVDILSGANVSDETWDHFYDEYSGRNALAAKVDTTNWQRKQRVFGGATTPRPVSQARYAPAYRTPACNQQS